MRSEPEVWHTKVTTGTHRPSRQRDSRLTVTIDRDTSRSDIVDGCRRHRVTGSGRPSGRVAGRRLGDASANGAPLLSEELSTTFQRRWKEVQTRFVDEPRGAVEDADGLVANLMQQLAEGFAQERERLEAQWGRGEDISTEDLRVALQRYRSFFQRLLST